MDGDESDKLLAAVMPSPLGEAAGAIVEMVGELMKAGMKRQQALYWSAVYLAALSRFPEEEPPDAQG